jgi:sRNA-binding protein
MQQGELLTKPGTVRVDLGGNPSGEVTEDQAQQATERLAQIATHPKRHNEGAP